VQRFGFSGFLFVFLLLLKPRARTKAIWTELKRASFQSSQLWEAMIFLFFLIDLLWMGAGLNPVISKEIFNLSMADSLPRRENSPSKRFFMNAAEEYNVTFRNFDDWISVRRSWLPNLNLLDGIAMVNNFDPLVPARYATWIKEISDAWEKGKTDSYHRLLALSGVKTIIETDGYTYQFVSLNGNERVQFFTCAEWAATPQEALIKVVSDAEVGVGKVVLESDREVGEEACRERTMNAASIRILSESAQRIQIEVRTNSAGWLVLNDTFYPGWIVTVNGTKGTMIAANSLFRAVSVGEGTSLVEFRYQPFSFAMGLILSILAFSALLHYNRSGWTPNV
jgi:hypothetical protein